MPKPAKAKGPKKPPKTREEGGRGYTSKTAIPEHVLAKLGRGLEETRTLSECLAINQSSLLRQTLPRVWTKSLDDELRVMDGIVKRMQRIGQALVGQPEALREACTHKADTVRGWACFAIGQMPDLPLEDRFAQIRPFAADKHFGVREWAWLAVRPHIHSNLDWALTFLSGWTSDQDENIRRFCSESTRPRGVWCPHIVELKNDPARGLLVLEPLRSDPAKYVQQSVANWLNDIAKDRPHFVRETIDRWQRESPTDETDKIVRWASKYV